MFNALLTYWVKYTHTNNPVQCHITALHCIAELGVDTQCIDVSTRLPNLYMYESHPSRNLAISIRGSFKKVVNGGGESKSSNDYRPLYHSLYSDTFMPPFGGGGGGGGGGRKVCVQWSHSQTTQITQQWHSLAFCLPLACTCTGHINKCV